MSEYKENLKVGNKMPHLSHYKTVYFKDDLIEKIAKVEIVCKETHDKGKPLDGGLFDLRMGVSENKFHCSTCNKNWNNCPGHIGFMRMSRQLYYTPMIQNIHKCLQCVCFFCHRLKLQHLDSKKKRKYKQTIKLIERKKLFYQQMHTRQNKATNETLHEELKQSQKKKIFMDMCDLYGSVNTCEHCNMEQPIYTIENGMWIETNWDYTNLDSTMNSYAFNPSDAKLILYNIPEEDLYILGFDKEFNNPHNYIFKNLEVMPPCMRPYLRKMVGSTSIFQDDITNQLINIKSDNNELMNQIYTHITNIVHNNQHKLYTSSTSHSQDMFQNQQHTKNLSVSATSLFILNRDIARPNNKQNEKDYIKQQLDQCFNGNFKKKNVITTFLKKYWDHNDLTTPFNPVLEKIARESIEMEKWINLQYTVSVYFNNDNKKLIKNSSKNQRPIRSLNDGFVGKDNKNIYRAAILGKRVNHCARTVVVGDPDLNIDEIGVPVSFCQTITMPTKVTTFNKMFLQQCVINGSTPFDMNDIGANMIVTKSGAKIYLTHVRDRMNIQLNIGDIVHRHMMNGDMGVVGRHPTLHRNSAVGLKVKRITGKHFSINSALNHMYNADYDGDELYIVFYLNMEAMAEIMVVMNIADNLIDIQNNKPLVSLIQDNCLGAYLMTKKDSFFDQEEVMLILDGVLRVNGQTSAIQLPKPAIFLPKKLWTGKQLVSYILKPKMQLQKTVRDGASHDIMQDDNENKLIVDDGYLISGRLCKETLGTSNQSIHHLLITEYDKESVLKYFIEMPKILRNYLMLEGSSASLYEYGCTHVKRQYVEKINSVVDKCVQAFKRYVHEECEEENEKYVLIETYIRSITENCRKYCGRLCLKNFNEKKKETFHSPITDCERRLSKHVTHTLHHRYKDEDDNLMRDSVISGAKGTRINLNQSQAQVGQQYLNGKRFGDDLPSHDTYNEKPLHDEGFVSNSYCSGLSSDEYFMFSQAAKDSMFKKYNLTADTGYNYRKMNATQQNNVTHYDHSVRNEKNNIISYSYGDSLNPSETQICSDQYLWQDITYLSDNLYFYSYATNHSVQYKQLLSYYKQLKNKFQHLQTLDNWYNSENKSDSSLRFLIPVQLERYRNKYFKCETAKLFHDDLSKSTLDNFILSEEMLKLLGVKDNTTFKDNLLDSLIVWYEECVQFVKFIVKKTKNKCFNWDHISYLFLCHFAPKHIVYKLITFKTNKQRHTYLKHHIEYLKYQTERALIERGIAVGTYNAQAFGRTTTQTNLNGIHTSGTDKMTVLTGIPRLKEITTLKPIVHNPVISCNIKQIPSEMLNFDQSMVSPEETKMHENEKYINKLTKDWKLVNNKNVFTGVKVLRSSDLTNEVRKQWDVFYKVNTNFYKFLHEIEYDTNIKVEKMFLEWEINHNYLMSIDLDIFDLQKRMNHMLQNYVEYSLAKSLNFSVVKKNCHFEDCVTLCMLHFDQETKKYKMLLHSDLWHQFLDEINFKTTLCEIYDIYHTIITKISNILLNELVIRGFDFIQFCEAVHTGDNHLRLNNTKSTCSQTVVSVCTKKIKPNVPNRLKQIMRLPFVDSEHTITNDIMEVLSTLGCEAAYYVTCKELYKMITADNSSLDEKHVISLADHMYHKGYPITLLRTSMDDLDKSAIEKGSFEKIMKTLVDATFYQDENSVNDISSSVLFNEKVKVGTGTVELLLEETSHFKHVIEMIIQNQKDRKSLIVKILKETMHIHHEHAKKKNNDYFDGNHYKRCIYKAIALHNHKNNDKQIIIESNSVYDMEMHKLQLASDSLNQLKITQSYFPSTQLNPYSFTVYNIKNVNNEWYKQINDLSQKLIYTDESDLIKNQKKKQTNVWFPIRN